MFEGGDPAVGTGLEAKHGAGGNLDGGDRVLVCAGAGVQARAGAVAGVGEVAEVGGVGGEGEAP